jgi:hypothetical protein
MELRTVVTGIRRDSIGFGDTIEKFTRATGIKKFVDTVSDLTGVDCGCSGRKESLNDPNILVNKLFYNKNKEK